MRYQDSEIRKTMRNNVAHLVGSVIAAATSFKIGYDKLYSLNFQKPTNLDDSLILD